MRRKKSSKQENISEEAGESSSPHHDAGDALALALLPDFDKKFMPFEDPTQTVLSGEGLVVGEGGRPDYSSPEWSAYVLKQFTEDEVDDKGNPFVHGLRRVARMLLGPILVSKAKVVQAPTLGEDRSLTPTTVEYTVRFLWCLPEDLPEGGKALEVEFSDCADVWDGNTDIEFAKYPSAMAATRAEGRCLRKALRIRQIAAEESNVSFEQVVNGKISPSQANFIDLICQRCNINVLRYIGSWQGKYEKVEDIPYNTAAKMVEHLSGLQNKQESIPEGMRGYE